MKNLIFLVISIFIITSFTFCTEKKKSQTKNMITIQFQEEKPTNFGYTGLHLYAVTPSKIDAKTIITIDSQAKTINYYKLYQDIAILLSNNTNPLPHKKDLRTFAVYGNPDHKNAISHNNQNNQAYHVVGYLDTDDITKTHEFLKTLDLQTEKGCNSILTR